MAMEVFDFPNGTNRLNRCGDATLTGAERRREVGIEQVARPDAAFDLALVLSGGNALGAYQAGAYQALHDRAMEPARVAGASIGAVNGALICGNPRERRIARLDEWWRPAPGASALPHVAEEARRTAAAAWTAATGHARLFVPRNLLGPWWNPLGSDEPSSLYDAGPLGDTVARLVDFELLNRGRPRYLATAVDLETGEEMVFDTAALQLRPAHVRASGALLPAFAPVEVDGRLLGDGGISANLPLDPILADVGPRPLLCIAIDLLPRAGRRPRDLGDAALRMQDLIFAMQSRRTIAGWQAVFDERVRQGDRTSVTLLHLAYADQSREVSGKAFDFSPQTAAARWACGRADMDAALDDLAAGRVAIGEPGLSVHAAPAVDRG